MESIPARPGSPLPRLSPLSNRASHLVPTRRAPVAPPSGSRSRPPIARTKSSHNISSHDPLATSLPRAVNRSGRPSLARNISSADLPSLVAPGPPPASTSRSRPKLHDDYNLLASFPEPPPLRRRASEPLVTRTGPSYLTREKPSAHQAKRITVSTTLLQRSPLPSHDTETKEATVATPPVICPALPADLIPYGQRHLRRSPPRSPRALRESKRGSPLKRGWSAEDMLRDIDQEDEIGAFDVQV